MNALLIEAIHQLNLKPGETYTIEVDGCTVDIRQREIDSVLEEDMQPMMVPRFASPELPGGYRVCVKVVPMEPPAPYRLDENDLAPGYLEDFHDLPSDNTL